MALRPITDATRISTLSHLHAFYAWAETEHLVESSPTEAFRGRGTAGLTLAPTPAAMQMNGPDEVSVALVPVSPAVELYRVTLELGVCEACGDQDDRLRRLGGIGEPLCQMCYQRAKRAARKAGEALRDASWRTTAVDLRSELVVRGLSPRTVPDGTPVHPDAVAKTFERRVARSGFPRIRFQTCATPTPHT